MSNYVPFLVCLKCYFEHLKAILMNFMVINSKNFFINLNILLANKPKNKLVLFNNIVLHFSVFT